MKTIKTIYDIAKEAGVSASTVSRIVNNKSGISLKTKEKVQILLEKYNYTPNEAARGLVKQSSKIIGILIEDIRITHHTEAVYVIEQEMTKQGYTCITLNTGTSEDKKTEYIKILEQRRVEGVILIGSMFGTQHIKESIKKHLSNIPIVIVNGHINLKNIYNILIDEKQGIEDCTNFFLKSGKKKISFISDCKTPSNKNKTEGYISAMKKFGCEKKDILVYKAYDENENIDVTPENTISKGYEITKKVLNEHNDIQGIIYSVDLLAVGGIQYLKDTNISIPEKISIIGVDNSLYGKICSPKLTTLNNKLVEVSKKSAKVLIDALAKKKISSDIIFSAEIIERETT